MTNTLTINEKIGNLKPLSLAQVNSINTQLDIYLDSNIAVSKSALSVAVLISKSGVISKAKIDTFKSISNTEILGFTKRFVIDGLGIADFNTYNASKKEGLKRAMKIALALIKENAEKIPLKMAKFLLEKMPLGKIILRNMTTQHLLKCQIFL